MGTHTFPFEFQLPPTLPASFQHSVGRVTYSVKGVIDLPWAIDVTTKSPFTVSSILDLNLWPDVKVFCSFVFLRRRKFVFFGSLYELNNFCVCNSPAFVVAAQFVKLTERVSI